MYECKNSYFFINILTIFYYDRLSLFNNNENHVKLILTAVFFLFRRLTNKHKYSALSCVARERIPLLKQFHITLHTFLSRKIIST